MKEPAGVAAVRFGRAVRFMRSVKAAKNVVLGRPAHVVADEEIQQAIAIVVKPEGRSAEALTSEETAHARRIQKSSFAGISKEPALPDASDENVWKSIVVVVADSDTHAVHLDIETRASRHIRKRAVAVVPVEPESGSPAFVSEPVHAVDEKDVLPAIAIVIEESATGAQGFWKQLTAIAAAVVLELEAGRGGHVRKPKRES